MPILGITGGVATGKSTVTRLFADLGASTVSADRIAAELTAPGTKWTEAVLQVFPDTRDPKSVEGAIDRTALARRVFADAAARAQLEAILHPPIIAELRQELEKLRTAASPLIAAEIPLLFEAGLETMVDYILVVYCAESTQIQRICARSRMTEAEARLQIGAQWPVAMKLLTTDFEINTDKDIDEAKRQVEEIWCRIMSSTGS